MRLAQVCCASGNPLGETGFGKPVRRACTVKVHRWLQGGVETPAAAAVVPSTSASPRAAQRQQAESAVRGTVSGPGDLAILAALRHSHFACGAPPLGAASRSGTSSSNPA